MNIKMTVELQMKINGASKDKVEFTDAEKEDMERCLVEELGVTKATVIEYLIEMDVDK